VNVQKISAVTLLVASMPASVRFYRDLLGMEVIYGDENGYFSSLRTKDGKDPILNLCPIPTVMSCRLRVRFSSLPIAA
jgi:catechol 2,3-dioxygenase-like lactoylglutathione lyase family enzyme